MAKKPTDAEGNEPVASTPDAGADVKVEPADAPPAVPPTENPEPAVFVVASDVAVAELDGAAGAEPTAGVAPDGTAVAEPPAKRRRSLKWLWWTLIGLVIVGLLALVAYLIAATNDWRDYAADLEVALEDVKATAAQDEADRAAIAVRVDTVQAQLDTANARITELANEEANATDHQDALRDHIEAMIQCADARQELIDVLTNSNLYFPGKSNGQVENELKDFCDSVKTDYEDYLAGEG